jgi:Na+-transporting NADH:ubiquinone oxidoreductase subunit NqrB
MILADARLYQIAFLSLFLLLGVAARDWTLHPEMVMLTIVTCLMTQWLCLRLHHWRTGAQLSDAHWFLSPLITSLGLSLLLRVDHYDTVLLASVGAIGSKFLLRFSNKHLYNPANMGILIALLLTQDAWVSPGQWGESGWYALLFLGTGGLVLQKVGRWDTTVAFLATYAGLEAARNLWLGWTWDVWLHRLTSGSLLLFALFMITDPRTIPNARIGRLIWAGAIATLTFILRNDYFLSTAVLWSLFALTPLIPVLDWLFPAERFNWRGLPALTSTDPTPADSIQPSICKISGLAQT